jgi:hypothetical protein
VVRIMLLEVKEGTHDGRRALDIRVIDHDAIYTKKTKVSIHK